MYVVPRPDTTELKIAFWTLGCRLNQYDTESLKVSLAGSFSARVVPWRDAADVYVLNSCTVTGKADQECRRLARQVKRRQPHSRVVVAGCYAQTQPDALRDIPEIDGVVGNADKNNVADWLPAVLAGGQQTVRVNDFARETVFESPTIDDFGGRSRAFVKVQDGCDYRCTYCLIWKARGPSRSRAPEQVLTQLKTLAMSGFREVILAGIHLGLYGADLGMRADGLVTLLRRCLDGLPDLRLRLSSVHPDEVTPELLQLFAEYPHLRPHLHLSLQSGSDTVLRRMGRTYDSATVRRAVTAVQEIVAGFGIGADIIVGFPGETDAEFAQTRQLVADLDFSYLHVFRYSVRPSTRAAKLEPAVHPETVSERSASLRQLADEKQRRFRRSLLGRWREAIVETETETPDLVQATTDNYATVMVPARWPAGSLIRCRPDHEQNEKLYAAEAVPESDANA